jgi:hypothetical protein
MCCGGSSGAGYDRTVRVLSIEAWRLSQFMDVQAKALARCGNQEFRLVQLIQVDRVHQHRVQEVLAEIAPIRFP